MNRPNPLPSIRKPALWLYVTRLSTAVFGLGCLGLSLAGCQQPHVAAIAPPTASIEATPIITATASPSPTPSATFTPTPTATPSPTPTLPPRRVAIPPSAPSVTLTSPWVAASVAEGEARVGDSAEFALIPTSGGLPVAQRPLVLAVPFTTQWENVTWAQAQTILAEGDPRVTVMRWEAITPRLKPLRIDGRYPTEPDYPLQETWSLLAANGLAKEAEALLPQLQAAFTPPAGLRLTAVGDMMLDRALGYQIAGGNLTFPFEKVVETLRAGDITLGNVESALGDIGEPVSKSYTFQAPPDSAESLAWAGFDVVTLANNHALDYGPAALLQGLDLLHAQKIATIGAGRDAAEARQPYLTTIHGIRLAFLGYVNVPVESKGFVTESWTAAPATPGVAWALPDVISADVQALAGVVDQVVVVLHSGYEYQAAPSPPQMAAARAAIDAGAALVIGHHAHILQGIEFYHTGVIVYGLGNFAFEIDGDPASAILNVWLDKTGVRALELIPALVQFGGQPRLAAPDEARAISQRVAYLTSLLNAATP